MVCLDLMTLIWFRNYTVGATDSQTYKDSSTKITHNLNKNHDPYNITPKLKSVFVEPINENPDTQWVDPNKHAMESLKQKLQNFMSGHNKVVNKLQNEIEQLKSENMHLKNKLVK